MLPIDEVVSRYYFGSSVTDRPGTMARIATILGKARSESPRSSSRKVTGRSVPLILMIHDATNAAMAKALAQIAKLPVVKEAPVMIRVENFE